MGETTGSDSGIIYTSGDIGYACIGRAGKEALFHLCDLLMEKLTIYDKINTQGRAFLDGEIEAAQKSVDRYL